MTIYFDNCDYKYEAESIMKMFIPLESFGFVYNEKPSDTEYAQLIENGDTLTVNIAYSNETREKSCPVGENGYTNEQNLCRMLFLMMSDITGIKPKWGSLTGIRPVVKVNKLISQGLSKDEIYGKMKSQYFISDEKMDLAYTIANVQKNAIDSFRPDSYSLYIAIPFCPARCSYCSFVSHSIRSAGAKKLIPEYTEKLCTELEYIAETAKESGLVIDTVYIGGGTPTAIPANELDRIMKKTAECFDTKNLREYTVEAGRADTITAEKLAVIKENGATRISINPQTMVDSVLEAIGRHHTSKAVTDAFRLARDMGFDNINMDTIAGLPTDTFEGFKYTIDTLTDLSPEDITVHTLTVKRSAELFSHSDEVRKSIDPKTVDDMVCYAQDTLMKNGYLPYYLYRQKNTVGNLENVGYAKNGYVSLYNIYIMEEIQTILAAGASGSTKLVDPVTNEIRRLINYKYPYEYISRFDQLMEKKKKLFEGYDMKG